MVKDCRLKIELSRNELNEIMYKFILNESGEKVGWCRTRLNKFGMTDVSYEIYNSYRGYGYSIEGIENVLKIIKNDRKNLKLTAKVNEKNIGAWRVLERTGFNLEKVFLDKEDNTMVRIYGLEISA